MNIIEAVDLSKCYGRQVALDQVNLAVPRGSIYGVVGPRNSGKTTLLRLLATLITPSAGDAIIGGYSLIGSPTRVRRMIGYMPQHFGVYPYMSVEEYIGFYAGCYGIADSERASLISDLLQLVDLGHRRQDDVTRLTYGMKQRLSLARALTNDPQLMLLDEPFSGADPRSHVEMNELIKELRNMGKSVLLTAPSSVDIEGLCTDMAVLDDGRVVLSGDTVSVQGLLYHRRVIAVRFFGNVEIAVNVMINSAGVEGIQVVSAGLDTTMANDQDVEQLPAIATVLKEIRADFTGSYNDASDLLRLLMRSGVQVVSYNEEPESAVVIPMQAQGSADSSA